MVVPAVESLPHFKVYHGQFAVSVYVCQSLFTGHRCVFTTAVCADLYSSSWSRELGELEFYLDQMLNEDICRYNYGILIIDS